MPPPRRRVPDDDAKTAVAGPSFDAMLEAQERESRPEEARTAIDARSFDDLLAEREEKDDEAIGFAQTASGASYDSRAAQPMSAPEAPRPGAESAPPVPKTMVLPQAPEPPPSVLAQRQPPTPRPVAVEATATAAASVPTQDARAGSPRPAPSRAPYGGSPRPAAPAPVASSAKPSRMSSVSMFLLSALVTFVVLGTCTAGAIVVFVLRGG